MNKIAIRFGDNDFYTTFINSLNIIGNSMVYNGNTDISKERLVGILNKLSPVMYATFQNPFEYNGLEKSDGTDLDNNKEYSRISNYLQIKTNNVMYDDEVDKHKDFCDGWDNSETFVLEFFKDAHNDLAFCTYSY